MRQGGRLVDAHLHAGEHIFDVLDLIRKGSMILAVNSTSLSDMDEVAVLKEKVGRGCFIFLGLHPNEPGQEVEPFMNKLNEYWQIIDGIGEVGLDSKNMEEVRIQQFIYQVRLAEKLGKPVNVHSRGAAGKVLEVLSQYNVKGVLLHWFSGEEDELHNAADRGYFIGFGPPVVYSKRLQRLVASCPLENILTESDSPVRYSACFEKMPTDPRFVASVIFAISRIKRIPVEEVEEAIERNFLRYIGL